MLKKPFIILELFAIIIIFIMAFMNLPILFTKPVILLGGYLGFGIVMMMIAWVLWKKTWIRDWRIRYLLIGGAAFFIRLIAIFSLELTQQGDYAVYISIAQKLRMGLESESLYYGIFPHAYHFPIFLSKVYGIFGESRWVIGCINIFVDVIAISLCTFVVDKYYNKTLGFITGILLVMNPSIILFKLFSGGESLYDSLTLIALALFICGIHTKQWKQLSSLVLASIILGIANYFRPTGIIMMVAIALYILILSKTKLVHAIGRILLMIIPYIILSFVFANITTSYSGYEQPSYSFGWNLYVGSNMDSRGTWSQTDGDRFKEVVEELQDPSLIQKEFANEGIKRYQRMGYKIAKHFKDKYSIWLDESFLPGTITNWQSDDTRFPSKGQRDIYYLICTIYNTIIMIGVGITMVLSIKSNDTPAYAKVTVLYLIGIMALFLILEASVRYKGAYYGILTLTAAYGYYSVGDKLYHKIFRNDKRIMNLG